MVAMRPLTARQVLAFLLAASPVLAVDPIIEDPRPPKVETPKPPKRKKAPPVARTVQIGQRSLTLLEFRKELGLSDEAANALGPIFGQMDAEAQRSMQADVARQNETFRLFGKWPQAAGSGQGPRLARFYALDCGADFREQLRDAGWGSIETGEAEARAASDRANACNEKKQWLWVEGQWGQHFDAGNMAAMRAALARERRAKVDTWVANHRLWKKALATLSEEQLATWRAIVEQATAEGR